MVKKFLYRYPGDPTVVAVVFDNAEEFKESPEGWGGRPGYIRVNDEPPEFFDDPICDRCNAEIGDRPCMKVHSYLYCATCMEEDRKYIGKEVEKGDG